MPTYLGLPSICTSCVSAGPSLHDTGSIGPGNCSGSACRERGDPRYWTVCRDPGDDGLPRPVPSPKSRYKEVLGADVGMVQVLGLVHGQVHGELGCGGSSLVRLCPLAVSSSIGPSSGDDVAGVDGAVAEGRAATPSCSRMSPMRRCSGLISTWSRSLASSSAMLRDLLARSENPSNLVPSGVAPSPWIEKPRVDSPGVRWRHHRSRLLILRGTREASLWFIAASAGLSLVGMLSMSSGPHQVSHFNASPADSPRV